MGGVLAIISPLTPMKPNKFILITKHKSLIKPVIFKESKIHISFPQIKQPKKTKKANLFTHLNDLNVKLFFRTRRQQEKSFGEILVHEIFTNFSSH